MMKKLSFLLLICGVLFPQSAYIIDHTPSVTDVYSSASYKVYADTFGVNPDFGLRLCSAGARYVAATYSANLGGGNYLYVPVSWNLTTGSSETLVYTDTNEGGGCYRTPIDAFAFSQFRDNSRTPPVFVSAFPGRIHAMYSTGANGTSPSFVGVEAANGWLRGGYSVTRSFSQATGAVNANVNTITFETDVGSITKTPSDSEWGLSATTGRSMLMALCSDDIGDTCSDAEIINTTAQLPVSLSLGSPANDQVVYNRYVVVDGLGYPLCIGADLSTQISALPSNLYYGQNTSVTITLRNDGNVNITTNFPLAFSITGPGGYTYSTSWTITENLAPGETTTRNLTWMANGLSGSYTFLASGDSTNVLAECNEGNNNASTTVTVSPFYILHVDIDDNYTNIFPFWGRPYNVTMWITDSDNNTVPSPRYVLTETNGLNPFTPTQVWNDGSNDFGLKSYSIGEIRGNSSGYIQITMVPTCNLLYTVYSAENVDAHVGNYSMKVNAYAPGALLFAYNNTLTYDHPLLVGNYTCLDPGWVNSKELFNKNKYVTWVYDWLYEVYSITKKLVAP